MAIFSTPSRLSPPRNRQLITASDTRFQKRMPSCDLEENESSESSYDSVDSIYSVSSTDSSFSSSSSSESSLSRRQRRDQPGAYQHAYKKPAMPARNAYVAMDCEMIITTEGSACARVVLIDWKGRSLLDTHVKPSTPVRDFLTFVSGVTADDLIDAPEFETVQKQVREILEGKIVVGHALENDLAALRLEHPWWMIRDTAYYQPFMKLRESGGESFHAPRRLKDLCEEKLNKSIQVFGVAHCPYEDAKAALDLYKSHRPRWETCVTSQINHHQRLMHRQQRQQQYQQHYQQQQQQQLQDIYHIFQNQLPPPGLSIAF